MPSVAKAPRWLLMAIKATAFLASLPILGFAIYGNNNEQQLPIVQHTNDPSLYPGDPFVATFPYYASFLWQVLWIPFRYVPEVPLLLALTLLQRFFFLYSAGRLARALASGNEIAEGAAWCLFGFGMAPFLGWGTVLPPSFEHTSLAVACFLLSLSFLVEGKPLRAGICFGLAGLANIMHATHGMLLLLPVVAFTPELRARWNTLRGGLVALIIMSPAIYLATQTMGQPRIEPWAFLRLLWFYVPQHFFPSSWSLREWLLAGVAGACVALTWVFGRIPRGAKQLLLGVTVGHLLCLLAACAAEGLHNPGLVTMQFARSSDLWTPVAAVFVTGAIVKAMTDSPGRIRTQMLGALGLTAVMLLWTTRSFLGWLVVLSIPAYVATAWMTRTHRPIVNRVAPLVPLLWSLGLFGTWWLISTPPKDMAPFQQRPEAEVEATQWAQRQTAVDSAFLVDPSWSAFRMLSRRSGFVTWKEGAAILWYQPFAREWVRRLIAIGVNPLDKNLSYPASVAASSQAFARIDDARALQLARTFGLHYWIVPTNKQSALPVAYANAFAKALVLSEPHSPMPAVPGAGP